MNQSIRRARREAWPGAAVKAGLGDRRTPRLNQPEGARAMGNTPEVLSPEPPILKWPRTWEVIHPPGQVCLGLQSRLTSVVNPLLKSHIWISLTLQPKFQLEPIHQCAAATALKEVTFKGTDWGTGTEERPFREEK